MAAGILTEDRARARSNAVQMRDEAGHHGLLRGGEAESHAVTVGARLAPVGGRRPDHAPEHRQLLLAEPHAELVSRGPLQVEVGRHVPAAHADVEEPRVGELGLGDRREDLDRQVAGKAREKTAGWMVGHQLEDEVYCAIEFTQYRRLAATNAAHSARE